jgi:hypothetical protein
MVFHSFLMKFKHCVHKALSNEITTLARMVLEWENRRMALSSQLSLMQKHQAGIQSLLALSRDFHRVR